MAANKIQNVWKILTKVSDEVCWSGRGLYKVCKETFNSHFKSTAESQVKKRKIPKIKRKKGIGVKLVEKYSWNDRVEKCAPVATIIHQITYVASISTRVIARKLERQQKKQKKEQKLTRLGIESLFSALGPIFSSDSLDNACYVGYLTRRSNHRKS